MGSRFQRRWWALAAALLAAGVVLRAALYFPLAAFPIDSDGVLAGLCGFRVLDGQHPAFFPGGARLSAASCYVAAGFFRLVGPDRIALALTGLTWALLYLVFSLLFLRATLGSKNASLAFVFAAVPSAAFMTVTYVPWAYGEIVASCAATLWLAALYRYRGRWWQRFAFGVSVGLGIWFSLQTLMIALPAILWIVRKRAKAAPMDWAPAIAGAVVGAAPFIAPNVAHGLVSFTSNWAAQPASGPVQIEANVAWLLRSPMPQLLFDGFSGWASPFIGIGLLLVGFGFAIALRRNVRDPDTIIEPREAGLLLLAVLVATTLLYVLSQAGSVRGWTVRYVVPLYVVLPLIFGIGTAPLWRVNRWLAIAGAGLLLLPNLLLYSLPGTAARAELTRQLAADAGLRAYLARQNVRMVYGDYFDVYHLNFDSLERVTAIPSQMPSDYMHYGDALPKGGFRWALVGNDPNQIQAWARAAAAQGSLMRIGDVSVFIAANSVTDAAQLLAGLRAAAH
ncbi:MAG: hypothetical protein WB615_06285 [Candidatus Tumulicola sp.]